ncbi:MAG TPA: FAD-dependent oxidoreductase [Marmoricola sp.]|nr:FAD-dependent oxidoreductase [Marmoricola sp.]
MPYVVTQACCSDASCVLACPVNCLHPAPGEPGFAEAEMLYVDPRACVDCGACATACPVGAIKPHTALSEAEQPFIALNESYYADVPHADRTPLALVPPQRRRAVTGLRVAVVGAGPAGLYTADELLRHPGVSVDVYDRLPMPYGLARSGVAPDHPDTRRIMRLFAAIESQPGFDYQLGVELGTDVTATELGRRYHAVVHAIGALGDRPLGIPGEELPGSLPATSFVQWYNGHPDHRDTAVDLDGERVVVVGNGNVALDVARILTADPSALADTDIAPAALAALRSSRVEEVVVLGRRGPADAAFTVPELVGLAGLRDVDVLVEEGGCRLTADSPRTALLQELSRRTPRAGRRRIVLRFRAAPQRLLGDDRVTGVVVSPTDEQGVPRGDGEVLPATMVLRAVGHRVLPIPGLPYDDAAGRIPHEQGRVRPGVYLAGWLKRGPTGFIGTNKSCAEETVAALLEDHEHGLLPEPEGTLADVRAFVRDRRPDVLDLAGWRAAGGPRRSSMVGA